MWKYKAEEYKKSTKVQDKSKVARRLTGKALMSDSLVPASLRSSHSANLGH